jgi:hypothetical protein
MLSWVGKIAERVYSNLRYIFFITHHHTLRVLDTFTLYATLKLFSYNDLVIRIQFTIFVLLLNILKKDKMDKLIKFEKLAKYVGTCPKCGNEIHSGRKLDYVHIKCYNDEYIKTGTANYSDYVYKWSLNNLEL